jgi:hypothetical protein
MIEPVISRLIKEEKPSELKVGSSTGVRFYL